MTKSFLKWLGGKYRLFDQIKNYMPASITHYVEPFVGGGGMLFQVLDNYPSIKSVIINDLNTDLINCYKIAKERPEELISLLDSIEQEYILSEREARRKQFYYDMREKYNKHDLDELNTAAYFIFLNKSGYNGLYRVNGKGEFNVPCGCHFRRIYNKDRILECSKALQKVTILNKNFSKLDLDFSDSVVYLDPPYMHVFNGYTDNGFSGQMQTELKEFCDRIDAAGGTFLLSNSNCEEIKELYSDYNINYVYAQYMVNSDASQRKNKIIEVLVTNKSEGINSLF